MSKQNRIGLVLMTIIGGILLFNTYTFWHAEASQPVVYESPTVKKEEKIVLIEVHPTALNRIADCESGVRDGKGGAIPGSATHYTDNGTVVLGKHTDPKYGLDVGWGQINTLYHGERAASLGIDIFTEEGNKKYARMLYREQGGSPWNASFDCHGVL